MWMERKRLWKGDVINKETRWLGKVQFATGCLKLIQSYKEKSSHLRHATISLVSGAHLEHKSSVKSQAMLSLYGLGVTHFERIESGIL